MAKTRAKKTKKSKAPGHGNTDPLLKALRGLRATGPKGFEGFTRDALSSVTGQRFRLMKSTHQGGVDVLADMTANAIEIGLEGKKYGAQTILQLDDLKKKIVDAVSSYPGLDLWILAATREISGSDQRELKKLGELHGLAVEIIDWPASASALPPLAVLAAAAPQVAADYFGSHRALTKRLEEISSHADFAATRDGLFSRFTAADVGYTAAQAKLASWLRASMRDVKSAQAHLGGYANLRDPTMHCIVRASIDLSLNAWLAQRGETVSALLGGEGVGKTWAALSWWDRNAGIDGTSLPLVLVVPAKQFAWSDSEAMLASLLAKRTQLRTPEFWLKRVRSWLSAKSTKPKFWLLIDGIDERWGFTDWIDVLQPMIADPWLGHFAVTLTCRPDHWDAALQKLANLKPHAHTIKVRRFDAPELDAVLRAYGLSRDDFAPAVLRLMETPRLCHLAITRHAEIKDTSDVTAERLTYEDWKMRLRRRGAALRISDEEFRELVVDFGKKIRTTIATPSGDTPTLELTRRQLLDHLGRDSGDDAHSLHSTISEIVDGGWLAPIDGQPNRFRLQQTVAPYALGLALIDELKCAPEAELTHTLGVFLDPLRGQDFSSEILRAATTVAMLDSACSNSLRRQVIETWLSLQHFRQPDFDAFWRLIALSPELFIDLARDQWMIGGASAHGDDVLIKGIANATAKPSVLKCLVERATAWLGTYLLDPYIGAFLSDNKNDAKAEERRQQTATRVQEWIQGPMKALAGAAPPLSESANPQGTSRFVPRVVAILSLLPRAPFTSAVSAWAVSRAIMGLARHFDEVAWLLRFNRFDPKDTETATLNEAKRLLAIGDPLSDRAAKSLLSALATPAAAALAPTEAPIVTKSKPSRHQNILKLINGAVDPGYQLTEADKELVKELAAFPERNKLWQSSNNDSVNTQFAATEEVLSRWQPDAVSRIVNERFDSAAHCTSESLSRLSDEVSARVFILNEAQLSTLAASSNLPSDDNSKLLVEGRQTLARLANRSSTDQVDILTKLPATAVLLEEHAYVLAAPTPSDFDTLVPELSSAQPKGRLIKWLGYLARVPLKSMPSDYAPLLPLTQHEDVTVRRLAMEVIGNAERSVLHTGFLSGPWSYQVGMDREEAINGSSILWIASQGLGAEEVREISGRILPEALGYLALNNPSDTAALDRYAAYVQGSLQEFLTSRSRSLGRQYVLQDEPLEFLASRRADDVVRWIDPILQGRATLWTAALLEHFPVAAVCRALLKHKPEAGARLWTKLMRSRDENIFDSGSPATMPFGVPTTAEVEPLREYVLDHAVTDQNLERIALKAEQAGQTQEVIWRIERDLAGPSAGVIARALTLAGLLEKSAAADQLWRDRLATPPARGWLAAVYANAKERYIRNGWAHHWFNLFVGEMDRDRAAGYYKLFTSSADARSMRWADSCIRQKAVSRAHVDHWGLNHAYVAKQIEQALKNRKNLLYGHKVLKDRQAPWL